MRHIKKRWAVSFISVCVIYAFAMSGTVFAEGITVLDKGYQAVRLIGDTPFPGVNGATIGPDGDLYVSHTGNGTITKISLKTMKPEPFVKPYQASYIIDDIAADDKGNIYATGTTPLVGEVYRIDKNGVRTIIADGMAAPNGIEYNKRTGRLFVTECFQGNRVYEVDPTGEKEARLLIDKDIIPVPEGFDFDPDTNDLIIPDLGTGMILRVHPDTGAISTVAEKIASCIALTIGPEKKIYVPTLSGVVYRVSLDGSKVEKLAQLPPGLDNVAITKEGRLFVTSYWNATIYEVATDGSGTYKQLFPAGPNQPLGLVVKKGTIFVADAIMIRNATDGKYNYTKLNAWASHGMPLTLSLTDGPGDQLFWTDCIHGAVAIGNPATGEFKPVAGGLNRPAAALMSGDGSKLFVAEYAGGQITAVSLTDGAKTVLTKDLEGPLALALIDGALYVAEAKPGRISIVDPASGKKSVLVSSMVGKPVALAGDGKGNLLVLDGAGQKIVRINPKTLALDLIAKDVPVSYSPIGSYPVIEFPSPMTVCGKGDIYLTTANRGLIKIEKVK